VHRRRELPQVSARDDWEAARRASERQYRADTASRMSDREAFDGFMARGQQNFNAYQAADPAGAAQEFASAMLAVSGRPAGGPASPA
jgi:hypothetical protein